MSAEQPIEKFEGYAIVEIMGHQRVAGYVTTVAFGSVVMFKVVQVEVPPEERILEKDEYLHGHLLGAGSKVRIGRQRAETLVGAGSVYRMTRCTEAEASSQQPLDVEVVERKERNLLPVLGADLEDDDYDRRSDDDVAF